MNKHSLLLAAIVAAAAATVPGPAAALDQVRAHANMCMPATNDLTRYTYGIKNTTTGNRSVYCGFEVREGDSIGYDNFNAVVRNTGSVARVMTCYWTSGDPYGGGYSSVTTSAEIPADGEPHALSGFELGRPSYVATLGVRCTLPPGTALEKINLEPIFPA